MSMPESQLRQNNSLMDKIPGLGRGKEVPISNTSPELQQFSTEMATFLRAYFVMEGERRRGFVDFDLAPIDPTQKVFMDMVKAGPSPSEKQKTFEYFMSLRARLSDIPTPKNQRDLQQYDYLNAKALAHETLLQRRMGAQYEQNTYIEQTMNFTPEIIDDEVLQAQREIVTRGLKDLGYDFSRESIALYRIENEIKPEDLAGTIKQNGDEMIKALSDFMGKDIKTEYDVRSVQENDYWLVWASGDRREKLLRVNNHKRHTGKWSRGKALEMASHEAAGHQAQMSEWQRGNDEGKILDVNVITAVHDPEQIVTEGIAQTLHEFVPKIRETMGAHGELEASITGLRNMVYNNLHVEMCTRDITFEQAREYFDQYFPAEPDEEIRKQLEDRKNHEVKSTYLLAYGTGYYIHREYAMALSLEGKKEFLKYIYSTPLTPKQEYNFFLHLRQEKKYANSYTPFNGKGLTFPDPLEKIQNNQETIPGYLVNKSAN